jgi:hypothetical protein
VVLLAALGQTLVHLDVTGCPITDRALSALRRFTRLEYLSLAWCRRLTTEGMGSLVSLGPDLRHLDIEGCPVPSEAVLAAVCRTGLESLLISCTRLTTSGLASIATHSTRLRRLELACCRHLTTIADLARIGGNLRQLELDGCTVAACQDIATHCPNLRHLSIAWCDGVTDDGVIDVATRLPGLQYLDLSGASLVTDEGVRHLAAGGDLEELLLTGCGAVVGPGVAALSGLPHLRRLTLSASVVQWLAPVLPLFTSLRSLCVDGGTTHVEAALEVARRVLPPRCSVTALRRSGAPA